MNPLIQKQRENLLKEMSEIEKMELGALGEELRSRTVDGKEVLSGPYYKHQQWIDGQNRSRRVQPEEVDELRHSIEGRQHFEDLAARFVELTVAQTRAQNAPWAKKNATKSPKRSFKKAKPF